MPSFSGTSADAFAPEALKKNSFRPRDIFNIAMTVISGLCLAIALVPLVMVLAFVIVQGFRRIDLTLFTQLPPSPGLEGGGLANAILGTIIVVTIATAMSVPFGVMAAVYLAEFSQGNRIARWVRFSTNVLSGVPSIISGVFVYALLVRTDFTGYSAIAGGAALAILMLPTIIRTTDEALQVIPQEIRWASLSVGASRYQMVFQIVMPAAVPSILTGVTLAIARAAGETAPLIFTALSSPFWPSGIFEPIASLSVLIYNFASMPFEAQQQLAWAGALILVLLVLITSVIARVATHSKPR